MGDRCVAATSLRCCGGTPGDQDVRGTNELSKIESILGTRMSQNLSRDRRLACVTASIGVATRVPAPAEGPEVLFQAADKNLYSAKAAGRNCVIAG